jgi:hypothetical protein
MSSSTLPASESSPLPNAVSGLGGSLSSMVNLAYSFGVLVDFVAACAATEISNILYPYSCRMAMPVNLDKLD